MPPPFPTRLGVAVGRSIGDWLAGQTSVMLRDHRGDVATGHTPTPSHFPANLRVGGGEGGGLGLGGGGGLGPAEGEGAVRTPTYMA